MLSEQAERQIDKVIAQDANQAEQDSGSDSGNEERDMQTEPRRLRSAGARGTRGGAAEKGGKRKSAEPSKSKSPGANSPAKSKIKYSDDAKAWILPRIRSKAYVSNRHVRKAIEQAESSRATSYLQHVTSLLDLMKANMTIASL